MASQRLAALHVLGRWRPGVADAVTLGRHPSLCPERAEPPLSRRSRVLAVGCMRLQSRGDEGS
jgi:hypothetical protein